MVLDVQSVNCTQAWMSRHRLPTRDLCRGIYTGPDSLVTQSGSKMLTTGGGGDLEQQDLLFGFYFSLLYKWLILLFWADPCVLAMVVIILSLCVSTQHMTMALSLLAPSKLSSFICSVLSTAGQIVWKLACSGLLTFIIAQPLATHAFSCPPDHHLGRHTLQAVCSDSCYLWVSYSHNSRTGWETQHLALSHPHLG